MKKSNSITFFYVFSSICLLIVLLGGGVYGLYLSIGTNFTRSWIGSGAGVNNYVDNTNMSTYGNVNNVSSAQAGGININTTGSIVLSIALIILAILDIVSLIKQIIFFKQFKVIEDAAITKKIERNTKSKGGVMFFAVLIDILSIVVGVFGIFYNSRNNLGFGSVWVMYLINGLVAIFGLISIILLIIKIRQKKNKYNIKNKNSHSKNFKMNESEIDINQLEYDLLKLKHLRNSKVLLADEYESLRKQIVDSYDKANDGKNDHADS